MKKCIECDNILEQAQKFCSYCGCQQPELKSTKESTNYTASIGDKNVVSGNIIGKNEEFNISGPTTINKIEDETKKFITCAVSGQHLLRGRDNIVNCPKCKSDVSQTYYNMTALRCFNCDKEAYQRYSDVVDLVLSDGVIDSSERAQLNALATNLMIDSETQLKIEFDVKDRLTQQKFADAIGGNNELSGYYKIEFQKAKASIFQEGQMKSAFETLYKIHLDNISHDEVAFYYFMLKGLIYPKAYIDELAHSSIRTIDIFWEDFWSFLPGLKVNMPEDSFKRLSHNKVRFSNEIDSLVFGEVLMYINLFNATNDEAYLREAKSVYSSIDDGVRGSLTQLYQFVGYLFLNEGFNNPTTVEKLDSEQIFYYLHVIGSKHKENPNLDDQTTTKNNFNTLSKPLLHTLSILDIDYTEQMTNNFNQALENFNAPKFNSISTQFPNNKKYYFVKDGLQLGPFSSQEITNFIQLHEFTKDTLVWYNGLDDWKIASQVEDLKKLFQHQ